MTLVLTRAVGAAIERCELTHLARAPIDVARARRQHRAYEACCEALGCEVRRLAEEPDLPDAVFVEDAAVVLDELAVITRPGAATRRPETRSIAAALAPHRPLRQIEPPATLEGGDVLRVGRRLFVGLSTRSNAAAADQLAAFVGPYGYTVTPVPVSHCLHLKSAVTAIDPNTLLLDPGWVSPAAFAGLELLEIDPAEPFAANALRLRGELIYPAAFPRTRRRLEARGFAVRVVDVSELAKAEGGVTCCSLVVEVPT
ncbi:MAG TPA: arginine deiminase family protein [Candidatus Polarisedimenticolaceae bacterium]|nr:arginine deiminase family protein [Candidatus Polarisedimenticolaceae bacterium]